MRKGRVGPPPFTGERDEKEKQRRMGGEVEERRRSEGALLTKSSNHVSADVFQQPLITVKH